MAEYKMLIDGALVDGDERLEVINPATGKVLASAPRASAAQAEQAIAAAKAAQPGWAATPLADRREMLHRFADAIDARAEEIARTLVQEQGKSLAEAAGETAYAAIFVRTFADMEMPVETVQDDDAFTIEVHHKPLGVVAGITPWNFPVLIPSYKIAPALLLGNSFVLKPAPTTPLVSLILGEIAAGIFPAGVLNVIVDDNDLGPMLTVHPDIAKVSFTGSTPTGRRIMQSSADTLKRLTLELGGNDAGIVLDDADVPAAAKGIVASAFGNAGQVCIALKRLYVPSSLYDDMCAALVAEVQQIAVGDGLEQGTTMGPMQNKAQYEKARHYMDIAKCDGRILCGGELPEGDGLFVEPTVVADIADGSPLVDEEQFAPILPVISYDDAALDAVIEKVNASEFGLGGSVWSTNVDRARAVAQRVESGTVWINHATHFGPHIPFAGAKQSGIGSEFGRDGLYEFAQKSVISVAK